MPEIQESLPSQAQAVPASVDQCEEKSALGLSRTDQFFLVIVSLCAFCLIAFQTYRLTVPGGETIEIKRISSKTYEFQIEINQATWVEWMQLEAVGEATGRNIVADRDELGPFKSIDDVSRVKGIGDATLNKMRPHLRCSDCE